MEVLCKFFSKEKYLNEFRQGKIYLKSLEWYRNSEAKDGQKDVFEGSEYAASGKNVEIYIDGMLIEQVVNARAERNGYSKDTKASCFFLAKETKKNTFQFNPAMKSFGKHIVMVTDNAKFERMLYEYSLKHPELQMICGRCKYVPEDELHGKYGPFTKRDSYKEQNEWRICVTKHTDADFTYIDIGDISDITIILDAEKLFGA